MSLQRFLRGFTLVEGLVVTAIVVLLMGFLFIIADHAFGEWGDYQEVVIVSKTYVPEKTEYETHYHEGKVSTTRDTEKEKFIVICRSGSEAFSVETTPWIYSIASEGKKFNARPKYGWLLNHIVQWQIQPILE